MRTLSFSIESTVKHLLEEKKYSSLKDVLSTMNPPDLADVLEKISEEQMPLVFRLLPKDNAAEAFAEMVPEYQEVLIRGFSDKELKQVFNEMYVDDAADLVEDMPASVVKRILSQADPALRSEINEILKYPQNSAGSIMTTEYVTMKKEMLTDEAITWLRKTGVDRETIYTSYVVENGKLIGSVSLKDILLAKSDSARIGDIMQEQVISVKTVEDREDIVRRMSRYNLAAIPVVDGDERIVGIVTYDDAYDVIEEEATEDIEKMAAILPSEQSYLRSSPWALYRRRIPWLLLLMVSAAFTGLIITNFGNALSAQVVLTAFIPMLMDSGGNSGSQAAVTVIRSISLGELEFKNLPAVLWKELRTAFLCGLTLSLACFCKIMLVDRLLAGNPEITVSVAAVVCASLFFTVLLAKSVGCALPILAKKIGFDPAVMASPFITTIIDAISLMIYFTIARGFLFR